MALRDLTLGGTTLLTDKDMPKMVLLQRSRDFSVAANTVTAADVLQMVNIPAGFLALGVLVETQTVEWSTSTPCQVGDGNDTDGWLTTAFCNLNSTSTDICNSTSLYAVENAGKGKFYPVADTIDVIPNNDLDAAQIRVGVWGFMANPNNTIAH
jgi:hypothetical protein